MINIILLILVGILCGTINATAGGGALLIYPTLITLGVAPVSATATISLAVLPGLVLATYGYRKEIKSSPKIFWWLIIPSTLGAIIGARALIEINPSKFETIIPWLVLSAVLLLMLQTRIHKLIITEKHLVKTNRKLGMPLLFLFVFALAIYGGFFGVGVGLMIIAILGFSSRLKTTFQINGLKSLCLIGVGVVGLVSFTNAGLIDFKYGSLIAIGTGIGGYLGSKYSRHFSSHVVHQFTVFMGIVIVIYLFVK